VDFAHTEQQQQLFKKNPPSQASQRFEWREDDMLILNLVDQNRHTFGYVSLESPISNAEVTSELVHNMELFGKLASMAIENHYHYSMLERRNRRLKQILVTNNIFKLYLNINELLREVVWSVKFSMDFNLVGLALVTRTSGKLELKAVACDDKIKQLQLEEQKFELPAIAEILKQAKYLQSKSYMISESEPVFQPLKQIYYGLSRQNPRRVPWKTEYLILVPIKTRDHKISGFLLLDDPSDGRIPNLDIFRTIEILANQIAIAIDNRTMYSQMKKRVKILEKASGFSTETVDATNENLRIQRLVNKFFK
jgi:GAF domain-containing protein